MPLGVIAVVVVGGVAWLVTVRVRTAVWPRVPIVPGDSTAPAWRLRAVMPVALPAVVALCVAVVARYPEVVQGSGTPIIGTLAILTLVGHAAAPLLLTLQVPKTLSAQVMRHVRTRG